MVEEHEVIRESGGEWFAGEFTQKTTHRGYEVYIEVKGYRVDEIARMRRAALYATWKKSVDAKLDGAKETKKPTLEDKDIQKTEGGTEMPKSETQKILDDIKELKDNVKKTEPEKVKDMKAIMERVEKENREAVEKILENNNTAQVAMIKARVEKVHQSIGDKLLEKKEVVSGDKINELIKAQSKPWFQTINYKSPWLYGFIILLLVVTFIVIGFFVWFWGKIKSYFVSNG